MDLSDTLNGSTGELLKIEQFSTGPTLTMTKTCLGKQAIWAVREACAVKVHWIIELAR
jgi:hypothetical protein